MKYILESSSAQYHTPSVGAIFSGARRSACSRIKAPQQIAKQTIRQIFSTFLCFCVNFQRNSFHLPFCRHHGNNYNCFCWIYCSSRLANVAYLHFQKPQFGWAFSRTAGIPERENAPQSHWYSKLRTEGKTGPSCAVPDGYAYRKLFRAAMLQSFPSSASTLSNNIIYFDK